MTDNETIGQLKIKLDDIIKELRFVNYLTAISLIENGTAFQQNPVAV